MLLQQGDPLHLVQEGESKWGHSCQSHGWCIIGWALYVRNVLASHPPCWRPSTITAGRTADPQGREAPMSHPCWHNYQQEVYKVNLLNRNLNRGSKGDSGIPLATLLRIAPPHWCGPGGEPDGGGITHQPNTSHHLSLPAPGSDGYCLLQIQNCMRHLPEMLNFMNLKLKGKS